VRRVTAIDDIGVASTSNAIPEAAITTACAAITNTSAAARDDVGVASTSNAIPEAAIANTRVAIVVTALKAGGRVETNSISPIATSAKAVASSSKASAAASDDVGVASTCVAIPKAAFANTRVAVSTIVVAALEDGWRRRVTTSIITPDAIIDTACAAIRNTSAAASDDVGVASTCVAIPNAAFAHAILVASTIVVAALKAGGSGRIATSVITPDASIDTACDAVDVAPAAASDDVGVASTCVAIPKAALALASVAVSTIVVAALKAGGGGRIATGITTPDASIATACAAIGVAPAAAIATTTAHTRAVLCGSHPFTETLTLRVNSQASPIGILAGRFAGTVDHINVNERFLVGSSSSERHGIGRGTREEGRDGGTEEDGNRR